MAEPLYDLLTEVTRPFRERGDAGVFRFGTVTAIRTSPDNSVQTTISGDAWLRYIAGLGAPSVDDNVAIVQQGTDMWVLGKFA